MEHQRQVGEKERNLGEQLRETERTGERFAAEYSTRALLERIEGVEGQLAQLVSQLKGIEEDLKSLQRQLQQLTIDNNQADQEL
jgi:DNA repair exonuclease SbcCD ATPase subunit